MTISSSVRVAGPYTGTGSVSVYPFAFKVFQASDVLVLRTDLNGNITTLALTTDYSVSLSSDQNANPGGSINLNSPLPNGYTLVISSQVQELQGTSLTNNGGFYPNVIENALDYLTILVQQAQTYLSNALHLPLGTSGVSAQLPKPNGGSLIGWNTAGTALVNVGPPSSGTVYNGWAAVTLQGADSTGVNDSKSAFNSTLAISGYGFVPSGTYLLSANPNTGTWIIAPGVTFTGAGTLQGNLIYQNATSLGVVEHTISNALTTPQIIGSDNQIGFYQTANTSAYSFGQTVETWTPTSSGVDFSGQLTGSYGSFSHFGSGPLNEGYGGSFESFNPGASTNVTLLVGVHGHASNGGVSAGYPVQTPSNNGSATNLRGISGFASNSSSGVVSSAAAIYANAATNTGSGSITNAYGLHVAAQTAGVNNYAIYTDGPGLHSFGDAIQVRSYATLPTDKTDAYFTAAAGPSSPSSGRMYCGDGTGHRLEYASRAGGVDAVLGYMLDNGTHVATNGHRSSGGLNGYTAGAGGTVTQATSKATAVTLNKASGAITTASDALAAGASVTFSFFNSKIIANSVFAFSIEANAGTTNGVYSLSFDNVQSGVCDVTIRNNSGGSLSEAIIINFMVLAVATS